MHDNASILEIVWPCWKVCWISDILPGTVIILSAYVLCLENVKLKKIVFEPQWKWLMGSSTVAVWEKYKGSGFLWLPLLWHLLLPPWSATERFSSIFSGWCLFEEPSQQMHRCACMKCQKERKKPSKLTQKNICFNNPIKFLGVLHDFDLFSDWIGFTKEEEEQADCDVWFILSTWCSYKKERYI